MKTCPSARSNAMPLVTKPELKQNYQRVTLGVGLIVCLSLFHIFGGQVVAVQEGSRSKGEASPINAVGQTSPNAVLPNSTALIQTPTDLFRHLAVDVFRSVTDYSHGGGAGGVQDPVPALTQSQLKVRAYDQLNQLSSQNRPLTHADTSNFWNAVRQLHETGYSARQDVIGLYKGLGELDISLRDRLEVCRYVGQDNLFAGRLAAAAELFDKARDRFDLASEAEQRLHADTMANILYLRGSLLRSMEQPVLAAQNDLDIINNPLFAAQMEVITVLSCLERIGDQMMLVSRINEAHKHYVKAVELVTEKGSKDEKVGHHVRLAVKELDARAKASQFETAELREALRALREKFRKGDYEGYDMILKALVVADKELKDSESLIADLKELRKWIIKNLESDTDQAVAQAASWRHSLQDASRMLILTLYDDEQRKEARMILEETDGILDLPDVWKQALPKELWEKSVLETERSAPKKTKANNFRSGYDDSMLSDQVSQNCE